MNRKAFAALAASLLAAACAHTSVPDTPPPPPPGPPAVIVGGGPASTTSSSPSSSAAAPRTEVSAASLQDAAGLSPDAAIDVPVGGDEVKFENEWMFDHFGRFRRRKFGVAHQNDRHYDVINIELADHSEKTVYFDITDLWRSWEKEQQAKDAAAKAKQ